MCGIAGVLDLEGKPVASARLVDMIASVRHRGPDGVGLYSEGPIGLAHARLSIIDIAGGAQPIHNEDGSVQVVFNGEIFNYLELRSELSRRGHRFYTRSDTEVIVHLYEEYGREFVAHLNGQFAIALWDQRARRLLLVRDRVGIAPLYYHASATELLFGSEMKALFAGGVVPRAHLPGLDQVFTFWSPLAPDTVFEGVHELPPGHWLEADGRGVRTGRYWDFEFPEGGAFDGRSEAQLAEELRARLEQAARIRLRADVPVGAYLSGGLDSSVIASLISGNDVRLCTFSIGFDSETLDETPYQQAVVHDLGTAHVRMECVDGTVADAIADTIWHTEMPVLRTAPAPMRLLSGFARANGFKVVLTGEGADEVFGGYDIFKEDKVRRYWAARPTSARRPLLLRRLYPYLDIGAQGQRYLQAFFGQGLSDADSPWFSHLPRWSTTAQCKQFFSDAMQEALAAAPPVMERFAAQLPASFRRWHPLNRAQYLESKVLLPGYLLASQGDRMLMANAVEGRFPYLDHHVIEFAARLPPRMKLRALNEKYLLKRAMAGRLPPSVLARHKQPYRAPDIAAFIKAAPECMDLLAPDVVRDYGYFDPARVALLVRKAMAGKAIGYRDNMAFVGILTTQIWHHRFIADAAGRPRLQAPGQETKETRHVG
ncbi:MAG: asparagine synthase (glutamine-hydrolyzing) [Thiohalomonadaceae bacterium]